MTTARTPTANRLPIDPRPDAFPMPNQTDKTLARIRTDLLMTFSAADWATSRDTDVASHPLKFGGTPPDFLPPDAHGHLHSSKQMLRDGHSS